MDAEGPPPEQAIFTVSEDTIGTAAELYSVMLPHS